MLMEKAEDKVWLFNDCEKNETEKACEGQLSSSSCAGEEGVKHWGFTTAESFSFTVLLTCRSFWAALSVRTV